MTQTDVRAVCVNSAVSRLLHFLLCKFKRFDWWRCGDHVTSCRPRRQKVAQVWHLRPFDPAGAAPSWWCRRTTARPCSSPTARRPPPPSLSSSCGSPSSRCALRRRPTAWTSPCRSPTGCRRRSGTVGPGGGACWRPAGSCWGSGTCIPRCRQSEHERKLDNHCYNNINAINK